MDNFKCLAQKPHLFAIILKHTQFKKGGENFCLNGEAFLVAFFVKGEKEFPARHRHYQKKEFGT